MPEPEPNPHVAENNLKELTLEGILQKLIERYWREGRWEMAEYTRRITEFLRSV
jgi:hypothetical protein